MKKILLATTVLAMSAGYAAADVSLSGNARMGVLFDGNDLRLTSRARVNFTMSGETDGGLAFGASFRADQAGVATNGGAMRDLGTRDMQGGSVFISGEFGRLTFGSVDGAAEWIVGDLQFNSLTGLEDLNETAFLSNGGAAQRTAMRYQYELGGLRLAVSADQPAAAANAYSVGIGYAYENFSAGVGYEKIRGGASHAVAFVQGEFSGVTAKAIYGRATGDVDQYGMSLSGTFDATTVSAFARRDFADNTHYGIGAAYDLGGGATLTGGVSRNGGLAVDQTTADLGLSFSF